MLTWLLHCHFFLWFHVSERLKTSRRTRGLSCTVTLHPNCWPYDGRLSFYMYFCWLTRRTSVLYWINCAYLPWDLKYKCKKTNRIANRIAMNFDMSRTCWTGTYYDWCWFNVAQINCCCIERCIELNVTLLAYMDRRWKQFFCILSIEDFNWKPNAWYWRILCHDTRLPTKKCQDLLDVALSTILFFSSFLLPNPGSFQNPPNPPKRADHVHIFVLTIKKIQDLPP